MTRPTDEQIKAVTVAFATYLLSRRPGKDGTIRVEMDSFFGFKPEAATMRSVMRDVCGQDALVVDRPSAWARTMAACALNHGFSVKVGNTNWRVVRAGRRNWKIEKIADVPAYKPMVGPVVRYLNDNAFEPSANHADAKVGVDTAQCGESKAHLYVTASLMPEADRKGADAVYAALQKLADAYGYVPSEGCGDEFKLFSWQVAARHVEYLGTLLKPMVGVSDNAINADLDAMFSAIKQLAESYGYIKPEAKFEGKGGAHMIYAREAAAKHVEYLTGVLKQLSRTYSPVVLNKVSSTLLYAITGSERDAISTANQGLRKLAESYGYVRPDGKESIGEAPIWEDVTRHIEYLTDVLKKLSSAETLEYKPEPVQMVVGDEFEPLVGPDFSPFMAVVKCVQTVANRYGYSSAARGEWSKKEGRAWQVAIDQMRYLNGMLGTLQETAIDHATSKMPQARYGLFTELTALAESYGYNIPWWDMPADKAPTVWENARSEVKHLSGILDKLSRLAAAQVEAFSTALGCEVPDEVE